MLFGGVNWSDPQSVAGSAWFPKYKTKVMSALSEQAQRNEIKYIEMLAIHGGPVSQLEKRTMPNIIKDAVKDLQVKSGVSISLLGDPEQTKIKVFLRTMEYDEFFKRFEDRWLHGLQQLTEWKQVVLR